MQPGKYNFTAPQGATFNQSIIYKVDDVAVDLTGYTAKMQVRKNVSDTTALISLSTDSGITITPATGTITLNVAASTMSSIPAGSFVYDLEINNNGVVTRLIEGKFIVTPEVTRS